MDPVALLLRFLVWFGKVIVTPRILSQTSDLADLGGEELFTVRQVLRRAVESEAVEFYDPSKTLVSDPVFAPRTGRRRHRGHLRPGESRTDGRS